MTRNRMMAKNTKIIELFIVFFLVAVGVVLRFLPHAPNFAPIAALALFSGVYLPKKLALIIPVAAMLISDFFLGFYEPAVGVAVYGCFIFSVFLGLVIKKHKKWYTILGGSLAGSVVFFLVTNFAVWAFTPWYAKTLFGFHQCYLMAWPFFRNTLLGDLFYMGVFFGLYELAIFSASWLRSFNAKIQILPGKPPTREK